MDVFGYAAKDAAEIIGEFGTDPERGLDGRAVAEKMARFGPNKLAVKKASGWHIFLRQFSSAFVYLLLAAMAITIFMGEMTETAMIFIFLAVNTILGFFQEYRSEKTVQLLNKYALPRAKVLRGGKIERIAAESLVPGDIILLETGDRVPADARLLPQTNLTIDEEILTGESVPAQKSAETCQGHPSSCQQAPNLAFSGTDVLKGSARAVVLATGKETVFGRIAKLAGESKKASDFEKGISRFSQFILKLVGLTILLVFLANLLIKGASVDIFGLVVFSVALTVSVIPEALPLVTTFSLARGALRLAKNKVIVKRLSAIESLGSIEILCSDKTGTLTENRLEIADIFSEGREQTVWLANLASSFETRQKTEPFDIALEKGLSQEQKNKIKKVSKLAEEAFDPKERRNIVSVMDGGRNFLIVRGAPEAIMAACSEKGGQKEKKLMDWTAEEGMKGRRVLAVAFKEKAAEGPDNLPGELERDGFIFSGAVSFVDPIKRSSFSAVKKARQLGVRVVIITGDRPEVAGTVAHEIGLTERPDKVISYESWQKASDKKRESLLEACPVFARVSPEQKFDIIRDLGERHTVGFLGEGINDAPALKIAGVSLAVDSAADIAREASDIILLKKSLGVVIDGIREGREVFANTTKYIKSTLASNFGNFFAVACASLLIDFLPMLPIQILLLNLLSDTPMIAVSTDSVDKSELESPRKYEFREIIMISVILGFVSAIFDFIFFGLFYRISPEVLRTNWFIGSVLTELVLIFSIRTKSLFIKGSRPSFSLSLISILVCVLTIALPYVSFGQKYFLFVPPTQGQIALIFFLVAVYFALSETIKLIYYKYKSKKAA